MSRRIPYMECRRVLWLGTALLLLGPLLVLTAHAAKAPKNIDPAASCKTGDCHAEIGSQRVVHAPVHADECQTCHEPEGDTHTFAKMPGSVELCGACHEVVDPAHSVHGPVADNCLLCHDPHQSSAKGLMNADTQAEVCFSCHEADIVEAEYKHGPAALGACTMCHRPHSGPEQKLLRNEVTALCGECHTQLVDEMRASSYLHEAAGKGCVSCHNPHSGPNPMMLPATQKELCGLCHEDIVQRATQAAVEHAPAKGSDGCVLCHTPHGSDNPALLRSQQKDLCLGCHSEALQEPEPVANIGALLEKNPEWHGPIREGGCTGCHDPHGGKEFRLLVEAYPENFYSPYQPDNYTLCFTCHEQDAMEAQYTKTLTGFRDGDVNLHFLHVNKAKRGRTCRACHEVHASRNKRHLSDAVPYGEWDMPIGFEQSENGGFCTPGCHAAFGYDRTKRSK